MLQPDIGVLGHLNCVVILAVKRKGMVWVCAVFIIQEKLLVEI
jgi:hypothetical protein